MPAYDYECEQGHTTERIFSVSEKPFEIRCPVCKQAAPQIITYAPALHTLDTWVRDCHDPMVQRTHQSGVGYLDPNLGFDKATGKHTLIKSKKHREQLMKEAGVYEKPPTDVQKEVKRDRERKPVYFNT